MKKGGGGEVVDDCCCSSSAVGAMAVMSPGQQQSERSGCSEVRRGGSSRVSYGGWSTILVQKLEMQWRMIEEFRARTVVDGGGQWWMIVSMAWVCWWIAR